jgi:hypothetical protein
VDSPLDDSTVKLIQDKCAKSAAVLALGFGAPEEILTLEAFQEGQRIEVTKGEYKGKTGIVIFIVSGPANDQIGVQLDDPDLLDLSPIAIAPGDMTIIPNFTIEEREELTDAPPPELPA